MSVDFHDAENRQRLCRMIIRHVKDPLSICSAWVLLAKLNPSTGFTSSELRCLPPFGEETGSQNYLQTATAGSDIVQSGRPIFDDFFQHLWPYIGNNTANVVFQMVKRLWLIRIDQ
ncbi:hypothetical protein TNCV_261501 [Trichonephila clavipes]|nr:hypothetical protein TNCV_261501 [Trichonephila clavipes]